MRFNRACHAGNLLRAHISHANFQQATVLRTDEALLAHEIWIEIAGRHNRQHQIALIAGPAPQIAALLQHQIGKGGFAVIIGF
ncbi:MAG: hypothetical protein CML80_04625 [Rhodobiaceae bacterium]|nr:hypothetical protein [Rhodobiaceae bacterium]OUT92061.1 MAG: hypothetical protein CBB89_05420 [Rhizobiales bacterium TMED29]